VKYHVTTLPKADADIFEISGYLHDRSASGSIAWLNALDDAIEHLGENAGSHGLAAEDNSLGIDIKQFIFKTSKGHRYRLLYTILGKEVSILRVRGPGQAPVQPREL